MLFICELLFPLAGGHPPVTALVGRPERMFGGSSTVISGSTPDGVIDPVGRRSRPDPPDPPGPSDAVPQNGPVISTDVRQVDYHDADAQLLIDEVQQEYVVRYGGPDGTPVDRDEFSPPNGHFVVLYDAGRPVAMGGWRFSEQARVTLGDPDPVVELKRMYVIPASRGRGHARTVLAHLERTAAAAGAGRMVLETGDAQPEAVALYRSAGYAPIPAFGHYADSPQSIHLGKRLAPAE